MVVVRIKIMGPTSARELFTIKAFSTELNLIIKMAANISMLPERTLNNAIPNTAFSRKINIFASRRKNISKKVYVVFFKRRTGQKNVLKFKGKMAGCSRILNQLKSAK